MLEDMDIDLRLAKLNVLLKPCIKHNNPSYLEQYGHIQCKGCMCWLDVDLYDSWEEAVADWNDRPYVDSLMRDYIREVKNGMAAHARLRETMAQAKQVCEVVVVIGKENRVGIVSLHQRWHAERVLRAITAYEVEERRKQGVSDAGPE